MQSVTTNAVGMYNGKGQTTSLELVVDMAIMYS
jgi:hypothetical protein